MNSQKQGAAFMNSDFLWDEIPMALILLDASANILKVNRFTERLFGYRREEFVGKSIRSVLPAEDQQKTSEWFESSNSSAEHGLDDRSKEISMVRRDGLKIRVEARRSPISDGQEKRILVFMTDIQERKKQARALDAALNAAEDAKRDLRDFVYIVSHDIKAPLRGITSLAGWIAEDCASGIDEDGKHRLRLLVEQAAKMNRMLDGILGFSRMSSQKAVVESVRMDDLLQNVLQNMSIPANMRVGWDSNLPNLFCDRSAVQLILGHLVNNAIQSIPPESQGEVWIGAKETDDLVTIYVKDNGIGIDPRHHEKIFQVFQTLNQLSSPARLGLGLSLVKRLAERHGGRVWLESALGQGSTFYVSLPKRSQSAEVGE
jgi:PAS domain S-box-containing protein